MKAWGEAHNVEDKILMAGDPFCKFIKEIGADVPFFIRGATQIGEGIGEKLLDIKYTIDGSFLIISPNK